MILSLNYKDGMGHMSLDLDVFLPASTAQWRKLVKVMRMSYPDQTGEVLMYLDDRYSTVESAMKQHAAFAAESKKHLREFQRLKRFKDKYPEYVRVLKG